MINYYYEYLKRTEKEYETKVREQEKKVKEEVDYLKLLTRLKDENELKLKEYLKRGK